MATQTVRFTGRTGLTLTADVYDDTTAASFATGVTITESVGIYSFTLTDSAGTYRVCVKRSGTVIDTLFVKTTNAAATFDCVIQSRDLLHASQSVLDEMYSNVTDQLNEVIADTDELQQNQGDWATADVSLLALEATAQAILTDTAELQTNQGDWATADVSLLALEATAQAILTDTGDIETDTQDIQGRIPAALVSGRIDATVGAYQTGLAPLQPTTAGRTVDVTSGGCVGIDWNNIEAPTSTVGLTGTTISTTQAIATVSGAVTLPSIPAGWITGTGLDSTAIVAMGSYQIPQTVPAVGTAPTRDQAIAMMAARGLNAVHVGTTETVYKADGTTAMYTLTLTNDGTYTTAIARAS